MNTPKISVETIIRFVVLVVALINQYLTLIGKNMLPVTDDQTGELIAIIFV